MAEPAHPPVPDAPIRTRPRRSRAVLLAAIVALYVLSVPWYRDPDAELRIVFGLPDWVAVALACYVAVAVLNCVAWLRTPIEDDTGCAGR